MLSIADEENWAGSSRRILVVTADVLAASMAGPAIRAFAIAEHLAVDHSVRLISTQRNDLISDTFDIDFSDDLHGHVAWAEIFIFQGHVLSSNAWIMDEDITIVADVYDPMHIEKLEEARGLPEGERNFIVQSTVDVLNQQLERADFLLCASERQRLFWLGQLAGMGRLVPALYDADEGFRSLISVVPFGLSSTPPVQKSHGLRGVVDGIGKDDKILLWGGGLYNWFDPETLIRAVKALAVKRPDLRLVFMGTRHPNPDIADSETAAQARKLADQLDVTGSSVFFLDGWVPYDDRANYLLDADVGVSTHLDHLETTLSFRTRILDYLWAGLPIVATDGDSFAEIIEGRQLGAIVPPQNVDALVSALERLLYEPGFAERAREQVAIVREEFTWEAALKPLADFCSGARPSLMRRQQRSAFGPVRSRMVAAQVTHHQYLLAQMEDSRPWKNGQKVEGFLLWVEHIASRGKSLVRRVFL